MPAAKKMMAYCVKCRTKREMKDPKEATTKNGRKMMTGTCPVCGTKMFMFIKSK
jgi:RNase P subunit RPR2